MDPQQRIQFLLEGDVSIQYQVQRDLLNNNDLSLQNRIATEGWGKHILSQRKADGNWGDRFYQPKWISTHYTLLDLRNLNLSPHHPLVHESIHQVLEVGKAHDGGIQLGPSTSHRSDVCVNGMFLNYASYFQSDASLLESLVDVLLQEHMPDGGFNCRSVRSGATHSSMHSTISVLEGLAEYLKNGYSYRQKEVLQVQANAHEFLLMHRLFRSDHTGKIIKKEFMNMPYPSRWKYDFLRALDYFQYANCKWDNRMQDAIDHLYQKQNSNGTWNVQAAHPGKVHVVMEKAGSASRWNTLRALRVLRHFNC